MGRCRKRAPIRVEHEQNKIEEEVRDQKLERKHKSKGEHCVSEVIKRIIKAQNDVEEGCFSGCEGSIRQLKGRGKNELRGIHNTIPFILYCKGTCEPFIGSGVFQSPPSKYGGTFFGCVESPIFRAKKIIGENCVILELLLPVTEECDVPAPDLNTHSSVCAFFPKNSPVTDFMATGICLTLDLNSFKGITCLDPITPIPAKAFPPLESEDRKYAEHV